MALVRIYRRHRNAYSIFIHHSYFAIHQFLLPTVRRDHSYAQLLLAEPALPRAVQQYGSEDGEDESGFPLIAVAAAYSLLHRLARSVVDE